MIEAKLYGTRDWTVYTPIENCKRHGLDLQEYLMEAMGVLVEHGSWRVAEIIPAKIAAARRRRGKAA